MLPQSGWFRPIIGCLQLLVVVMVVVVMVLLLVLVLVLCHLGLRVECGAINHTVKLLA